MATALVIGNMIGSGIFFLPSSLAKYGSISIFGWIISAVGATALALVFIRLSIQYEGISGGPYVYSRKGFGDLIGFLMGWGYFMGIVLSLAGIAAAFVGYMSVFFPFLQNNFINSFLFGVGVTWLLGWINIRGIRNGGAVQVVTTILKLAPLFIIIIGGLFFLDFENFEPFRATDDSVVSVLAATGILTIFAFVGIECATIPAGNIRNPGKTIPRATIIGIVVTTVVYISATVALLGLLSANDLAVSEAPFSDAAIKIWGENAGYLVSAGVAISTFGALNGWILISGQLLYSISRDNLLPGFFKKMTKNETPANSIIFSCLFGTGLMFLSFSDGLIKAFEFLVTLSMVCTLMPYLFSAGTALKNTLANDAVTIKIKILRLSPPAIMILFSIWILANLSVTELIWGTGLFILGLPFFIYRKRNNNHENSSI